MAEIKHKVHLNLEGNQLLNAAIHPSATAPSTPTTGQTYFDTEDGVLKTWDGSNWIEAGGEPAEQSAIQSFFLIDESASSPQAPVYDSWSDAVTAFTAVDGVKYVYIKGEVTADAAADLTDVYLHGDPSLSDNKLIFTDTSTITNWNGYLKDIQVGNEDGSGTMLGINADQNLYFDNASIYNDNEVTSQLIAIGNNSTVNLTMVNRSFIDKQSSGTITVDTGSTLNVSLFDSGIADSAIFGSGTINIDLYTINMYNPNLDPPVTTTAPDITGATFRRLVDVETGVPDPTGQDGKLLTVDNDELVYSDALPTAVSELQSTTESLETSVQAVSDEVYGASTTSATGTFFDLSSNGGDALDGGSDLTLDNIEIIYQSLSNGFSGAALFAPVAPAGTQLLGVKVNGAVLTPGASMADSGTVVVLNDGTSPYPGTVTITGDGASSFADGGGITVVSYTGGASASPVDAINITMRLDTPLTTDGVNPPIVGFIATASGGSPVPVESWEAESIEWIWVGKSLQEQIDDLSGGGGDIDSMSWKQPVRVATTANINLANELEDGDSIDGVELDEGDRVLVKNQSSQAQNGIYVVQASGAAVRASDNNTGDEMVKAAVFVSLGSANANTLWVVTSTPPIDLGTDDVVWTQFGANVPDATESVKGIVELATVAEAEGKSDTSRVVTPAGLATFTRKYSALVGDGSNTDLTVTHNLNSNDVQVEVYDASTNESVITGVDRSSANAVVVSFNTAPSSEAYRVVVIG